jgi:hypothetical protein
MAVEWAAKTSPYVLYEGNNGQEICDALNELTEGVTATIAQQGGGSVTISIQPEVLDYPPDTFTIQQGERFGIVTRQLVPADVWSQEYISGM